MNRIVFAGGDMDGKVEEFEFMEGDLMYDGSADVLSPADDIERPKKLE